MHPTLGSAADVDGVVEADFGPIAVGDVDADWSGREVTTADLVSWLCSHADARRVVLRGARVHSGDDTTALDLTDLQAQTALVLCDCRFDELIDLAGAVIGRLEIHDCHLKKALRLECVSVRGGLTIHGPDTRLDGALRLNGATIGGQFAVRAGAQVAADTNRRAIDADGLTVEQSLFIHGADTRLDGALRLNGATIGGQFAVRAGAQLAADTNRRAIDANGLTVEQHLFILDAGTRLDGALRLNGATIGGQLAVSDGAQVAADTNRRAIEAGGLTVEQSLFIHGADLDGALHLNSATISRVLAVRDGARVAADADGLAIAADGLTVENNLFIQGGNTRLEGALRLNSATIGAQLAVSDGAQVAVDINRRAIDADGLTVERHLFILDAGTRLDGALRLGGATIGGQLAIHDGAGVDGDLILQRSDVATLTVSRSGRVGGAIDLSSARVRRLMDTPSGWAQVAGGWRLSGVTIEALSGTLHGSDGWTVDQRIDWLRSALERSRRPFTQIAGLYREGGHPVEARRIAMAGEAATSGWWRRLWLGATVGYGYQPARAALLAVVLIVLAWGATSGLGGPGLFIPTDTEDGAACPVDYPCLDRLVYTVETIVPVVAFGQRDAWRVDTAAPHGRQVQVGQYVLDAAGWLLALLVVGAVSGAVRRD